jgi:pimeloyl-ACP methyl ester carboxylesterase
MAPYRPGLIPLVLVHGTASSPARWAELINEIQNDRDLWGRYQVWLFTYNTGNPIVYTGGLLTEGLRNTVKELDPEGKDPAMKKMVVIGHSQGGLLTKLTAIDSGTRFWDNMASAPFDQLDVSPETRELLRRSLFYKPLPFVKRVVFIATPQQGSFVSGGWIGRLTGKFVSLPGILLSPVTELLNQISGQASIATLKDIPKSTDNMAPESPFVKAISSMPVAPRVIAHSIIPVKNLDDPKEKWNDGVVEYTSAHIDGAASELIVHSGHSTQTEPQTIEEIRRILIENLKEP